MTLGALLEGLGGAPLHSVVGELGDAFEEMDRAYADAAGRAGLDCTGCGDSCCFQKFSHYTLAEYISLREGLKTLTPDLLQTIVSAAVRVSMLHGQGEERVLCPLCREGQCLLYGHRPMICRLHGVPHVLHRPGAPSQEGPGCHRYQERVAASGGTEVRLDRTPHYTKIASIEIRLRADLQARERICMTVAEMILDTSRDRAAVRLTEE